MLDKEIIASKVDPRNARADGYREIIADIASQRVCPFCPDELLSGKWHTKPILRRSDTWLITENTHPYPNSQLHLLMIGEQHKEFLSELTTRDLRSVLNLTNWAVIKFNIKGGGLIMRFGDTLYTGATVKHLHAHLIVPVLGANGRAIPVSFPIG